MSEMTSPYHFGLVHRSSTSSECRACRNAIFPDQDLHTIVVKWEQEFNELDYCQACYDNHIQKYFKFKDFTVSTDHPRLLEFLSKHDA